MALSITLMIMALQKVFSHKTPVPKYKIKHVGIAFSPGSCWEGSRREKSKNLGHYKQVDPLLLSFHITSDVYTKKN